MSLRINHNTSAINSHRNMQKNTISLEKSLEKLSSGLKVNRASDGPASLVISEQMRAQIAGINQAVLNSEAAVSLVQTTEAALNEVNTLLINMRQLSLHAANEGVNDEVMLEADQAELVNSLQTIDRISRNTQFGTRKLLDGSTGANGTTTGDGLQYIQASTFTKDSGNTGYDVVITQNATKTSLTGSQALTEEIIKNGETLTIIENGKSASYTTVDIDNIETVVQNLRFEIDRAGLNIDVGLTDEGTLQVTHKEYGSNTAFQVSSTTTGILSEQSNVVRSANTGQDIAGEINGEFAIGEGQTLRGTKGAKSIEGLEIRYTGQAGDEDGSIDEEGEIVGQVHVSQNSLNFQVGGNRNQTVSISLINTSTDTLAKGILNESGFNSLRDLDIRSTKGSQDALLLIDKAINEISSNRADLGAFQKNTLESNLNNLKIASENLIAAESSLRDADMAQEIADFTKNQIMTQSSTAMLAQSNQLPNNVLSLLN